MTKAEINKLHTILAKVETLQNQTTDRFANERLQAAKSELLYLLNHLQEEVA